jgi:hypothetical protein
MFQLRLSPEMEFEMFRLRVRRWMLMADSSSTSPDPEPGGTGETATGPVASPATLPPNWITPDAPSVQPDTGALLGSFSTRGVQAGVGDLDVAMQLFQDRYRFVSGLPDLRAIVPGFARQWVPNDWRRIVAQSLTNMTIDSALKHDHPTFIEASDQLLLNLTGDPGVVPIYINLPSLSF